MSNTEPAREESQAGEGYRHTNSSPRAILVVNPRAATYQLGGCGCWGLSKALASRFPWLESGLFRKWGLDDETV